MPRKKMCRRLQGSNPYPPFLQTRALSQRHSLVFVEALQCSLMSPNVLIAYTVLVMRCFPVSGRSESFSR